MPEELDGVFEAAFQKALNFLSERRFNRLLFAFPEEALAKSFLEALKREGNSLRDNLAAIVETWTGKR